MVASRPLAGSPASAVETPASACGRARAVLPRPPWGISRCRWRNVLEDLARNAASLTSERAGGGRSPARPRDPRRTWRAVGDFHVGLDREADTRSAHRTMAADVERGDRARASL